MRRPLVLSLLLCAGFARAEKILVNRTHAPVRIQMVTVLAKGGTVEVAVYPHGKATCQERSAEPARVERFTEDQAFCGHTIVLPPRGAISLRSCRDVTAPQAILHVRMKVGPEDDPHGDVAAFEQGGLWVDYQAASEGHGAVAESIEPTFLSRHIPIAVEGPDAEEPRLCLVDPAHGICCVIL